MNMQLVENLVAKSAHMKEGPASGYEAREIRHLFNGSRSSISYTDDNALTIYNNEQLRNLSIEIMQNLSNEHHIDDPDYDFVRRSGWRGVILALYIIVIAIGLFGNSLVIYVVARNKHMQNVTNVFIANLALSDIGLCVFSLPVQLYYQLTDKWIFGNIMCRMIFTAFAVPMYVSTLTIFLIALDRYWLIVYPLTCRMRMRTSILLLLAGCLTSLILAIPVICFTSQHHLQDTVLDIDRKYCVEKWPNVTARVSYSVTMFVFQFCLPLCVTAYLYYKIYCRLRHRPTTRVTQHDRTSRTNKILFAIVVLFVVCWLPWNIYSLIAEIDKNIVRGPHFKITDLFLKLLAMSTSCINPFLYCWLNDNFRKEIDNMAIKLHIIRSSSIGRNSRTPRIQYHHPQATTDIDNNRLMVHTENNALLTPGYLTSRISISQSTVHTTLMP